MTFDRRTLVRDAVFEGLGLFSSIPVSIVVHPGENGIRFLQGGKWVRAIPENVTDTSHQNTTLGSLRTIEHLMSAFCGLEITDADVAVSGPELPALDGGSVTYVNGLLEAGSETIGQSQIRDLFSREFVSHENQRIAVAAGQGRWRYSLDVGEYWPGAQVFEAELPGDYENEIAPARTWGFEPQVLEMRKRGIGEALTLDNGVVLTKTGCLNENLKFQDEPARHKMLDALGDLYLAGVPARFLSVAAERSGHHLNVLMAAKLAAALGTTL